MADEQTQELPDNVAQATVTDSSVVADKFASKEFTRVNQEKEPIEKLADAIEAKPELSETNPSTEETVKTEVPVKKEVAPPSTQFDYGKWDGKVESLPEKLQKIVKDNQAMATTKAQEAAQLKQQLDLLTTKKPTEEPLFSQDEFEEAQINPNKMYELINKVAMRAVEAKASELMPVISQVQNVQRVAENEKAINDFAKEHEDFWDLHDASPKLFMSVLGQNKNLSETYELLKSFKSAEAEKAKQEAQKRVAEKKAASTFGRTVKHTENIMYVEGSKDDVLAKQIEMTMQGKNIQVKQKQK